MTDRAGEVLRFTLNERVQHLALMICVILLMVSGLSLRYADTWLGRAVIDLEGGMEGRGILHRTSAIGLIALWAYHTLYAVFTRRGHDQLMAMIPGGRDLRNFAAVLRRNLGGSGHAPRFGRFDDLRNFAAVLRRNLGGSGHAPRFGRFDFRQKFQYWAVAMGASLMGLTGFVLWFETESMAVMPKWILDVTRVVHSGEGVLIFVVLFIWHLYDGHLRPGIFPMDWSWITGRVSKDELKRRHPLEYDRLFGGSEGEDTP